MDSTGDFLPLAGVKPMEQGGNDADGELFAGNMVGMPDLGCDWRQIVMAARIGVITAIHHHAAQREMDQVAALEVAPGPHVAKGGHARDDQVREALLELLAA